MAYLWLLEVDFYRLLLVCITTCMFYTFERIFLDFHDFFLEFCLFVDFQCVLEDQHTHPGSLSPVCGRDPMGGHTRLTWWWAYKPEVAGGDFVPPCNPGTPPCSGP